MIPPLAKLKPVYDDNTGCSLLVARFFPSNQKRATSPVLKLAHLQIYSTRLKQNP